MQSTETHIMILLMQISPSGNVDDYIPEDFISRLEGSGRLVLEKWTIGAFKCFHIFQDTSKYFSITQLIGQLFFLDTQNASKHTKRRERSRLLT